MPSGILGRASLSANTDTTLYTVPSTKLSSLTINICNTNLVPALIRLAITDTGSVQANSWIFFDFGIPSNSTLEKTGIVMEAGEAIIINSSVANVTAMIYGYEE